MPELSFNYRDHAPEIREAIESFEVRLRALRYDALTLMAMAEADEMPDPIVPNLRKAHADVLQAEDAIRRAEEDVNAVQAKRFSELAPTRAPGVLPGIDKQ